MIERIENNQAILESEIAIRTSELREARDAALTASRTKSEFLSTLTHEIRTPLTAISGHTELTIEELHFIEHAGEAIQRLRMVLDTSRDLLGIMDEILTYAKAEAGKSDITLTTVELAQLVNRVSSAMQPMLLKNGNRLRVTLAGAPLVAADEGKIFHIVLNLVSNACKFTKNGEIHVHVECRSDLLSITVADNGIGIPRDRQKLIFEPFQQSYRHGPDRHRDPQRQARREAHQALRRRWAVPALQNPNGSRWWRFDYRFAGKRRTLSMGVYPAVGLKQARDKRDAARKQLAAGIDPGLVRKAERSADADSFEAVAREWFAKHAPRWAPGHATKIIGRFERDIFPWVGGRSVGKITAPELLACLRRIEARGAIETAHRTLQNCGQVFRYAMATGRAERDPAADLRGALAPVKETHYAAVTDPKAMGGLLRAIDEYQGDLPTRCALRLAPLTFVRPGELRKAEWAEFDLDRAEWNIAAIRMKTREPHLVPLSRQAVGCLRELYPLTGRGRYVFPGVRSAARPLSENTVNAALRRLGYAKTEMTGHGFRAMARTILDEVLGVRPDFIEHQLAHTVRDPLGRAYNRTKHLPERRDMMQAWADYLDGLKNGAEVVPLHGKLA